MTHKLVLASASPRRQELLRLLTDDFIICPADADETLPKNLPPEQQIETLALRKAEDVFAKMPDCIVIGADTMVFLDGKPLGKPVDAADAKRMLRLLSGRSHCVITGLAVLSPEGRQIRHRMTDVHFRELTDAEIERYIATGEPMDKAGAYGIQKYGAVFVDGIQGDYFNIVGLPVELLYCMLKDFGVTG